MTSRSDWKVGDRFAANDGSREIIRSIERATSELAAHGLEAILTVAPMD